MEQPSIQPKPVLGLPALFGTVVILLFFGGFAAWSALAPLESAAIARGEVSVETKRKTIQHLEGGIIGDIHVTDGDTVKTGQLLITLDETQAKTNLDLLQGRYDAALAIEARLKTERDGLDTVSFPEALIRRQEEPQITEILDSQRRIFSARQSSLKDRRAVMEQNIAQYEEEIVGLQGKIKAQNQLINFTTEEIKANKDLRKKGMVGKQRMLELQKEAAEVKGERSDNLASIARVKQRIASTRLEISELDTIRLNEVVDELQTVKAELFDYQEKINAAKYVLKRTKIIAPIAGIVVGMKVQTVGGVITPGEELLDIVPTNERLIIEARINPDDIDVVQEGLDAHVRFTAFSSRNSLPVDGKVITVSADSLKDERTGEVYYSAKIALTGDLKEALGDEGIYPGMQVDVMVLTGTQTTIDYFLRPITQSFSHAFREQ
ncbi:MAG: HlyD family type I secretion periplasmic adaptor subunit [Gammaproteobacteria bacterium]|nr:HlyD family type I secretion periplasmic adaptor subunit [Gammaproteobacteria bacterium]